ncbi:hypothetical protein HDU97_001572 [Phlyctochytrium planicorne]|nr:hypothetical protein HDU97_001572 [Phlyctochytrium planicorne]
MDFSIDAEIERTSRPQPPRRSVSAAPTAYPDLNDSESESSEADNEDAPTELRSSTVQPKRGILRPPSVNDDHGKKGVGIEGGGHARGPSSTSQGLPVVASVASSRRTSVISSSAQSELGTFLTMGIDLKADIPQAPPPVRRPSVMMKPPSEHGRGSVAAVYASNDPNRMSKIEDAVDHVLDDGGLSLSNSIEPPPIFGNHELAQVIDMVLVKVAGETPPLTPDDLVAVYALQDPMTRDDEKAHKAQLMTLQIKIKTSNAIMNELGKRMEKLQRWVNEVSTRAAAFEQERTHHVAIIDGLKAKVKSLEVRAETAEGAINAFEKIHVDVSDAGMKFGAANEPAVPKGGQPIKIPQSEKGRRRKGRQKKKVELDVGVKEFDMVGLGVEEMDEPDEAPKEVTREVILQTAKLMGVKKKFDPPTALGVGLRALADREEQLGANPMSSRYLLKSPYQTGALSFRSNKVPRLLHAAVDHKHHLSAVLAAQTQELLATKTPDSYIKVLHGQLNGMIRALHDCIDALSEEQRISEHWRLKWVRVQSRVNAEESSKRKEEMRILGGNSGGCSVGGSAGVGIWNAQTAQAFLNLRPTTVAHFETTDLNGNRIGRSLSRPESSRSHQRSRSADPDFYHTTPEPPQTKQGWSTSRPQYHPEDSLIHAPLSSIAMPSPLAKARARYPSATPSMTYGRAATAPEYQKVVVPGARSEEERNMMFRGGEHAPPPTPMPVHFDDGGWTGEGRGGRAAPPPSREGRNAHDQTSHHSSSRKETSSPSNTRHTTFSTDNNVPEWRLSPHGRSSSRYRAIVPRIASLGPFLSHSTPPQLMRALYATPMGKKWDTSVSIQARPRGDAGMEDALRPFQRPKSERRAREIRSARKLMYGGVKQDTISHSLKIGGD